MEQEISREEYKEWRESKVTKEVMKGLSQVQEDLKEFLSNGGTLGKDSVSTDFIVGRIQGLNDFLNVEYEEKSTYEH